MHDDLSKRYAHRQNDPTTASQNDKFQLISSLPYHNIACERQLFHRRPAAVATVFGFSLIDADRRGPLCPWLMAQPRSCHASSQNTLAAAA